MIIGEIVAGSGLNWTLVQTPVSNSVALYASGIRLTPGVGNDYVINGGVITTAISYAAATLTADYTPLSGSNYVAGITDVLSPYALTTLQRVKDLIFDPNFAISLTGAILTESSTSVTGITVQTGKNPKVGQLVQGTGIPDNTYIAQIVSASQITLSQASTQSNTGQTLTVIDQPTAFDGVLIRMINSVTQYISNECGRFSFVYKYYVNDTYSISNPQQTYLTLRNAPIWPTDAFGHVADFSWRAGTPSNPSWTEFIPDQYELIDPRTDPTTGNIWNPSGMIRVYGVLPRIYNNMIRASYYGGYPVNWSSPGDNNTHLLPADITGLCENLVVRRFTRRQLAGKSSQSLDGANIAWRNEIDAEDLDVLGQYRDLHF